VRILFIGDIYAKPGRRAVRLLLPRLREQLQPDVVIANGENMAGGAGVTADTAKEMFRLGIAALTTGNHVWDQREAIDYLPTEPRILRPLNYPPGTPGNASITLDVGSQMLTVICVQGRVFMRPLDDPFRAIDALLHTLEGQSHIFIDFHAEATAEKQAFAFHLDGRVSAVVGTHTHVPTADARVLSGGTAYITDVGMVGPRDSVIGGEPAPIIRRHMTQMYQRFDTAKGPVMFNAVTVDLDASGRATAIQLVQEEAP
jgi:2',3'-cyclic-nucleotide 2'-phosphodiesterase